MKKLFIVILILAVLGIAVSVIFKPATKEVEDGKTSFNNCKQYHYTVV
ncbi:hypothetical protein [Priestia aryabhattai]|nr:hypothetical protein [Priestia aryabhattai]